MYIKDFMERVTRKANISILIYLVINVFVIAGTISILFSSMGWSFGVNFLIGVALYGLSLTLALSPIGEWILRLMNGCNKIKRADQKEFIEPLFNDIYKKAKELDTSIPDDVELFICADKSPNAFATGRKTICITEGLLSAPVNQIKATLAHEFGHLAHKDTDLILAITVGNLIVNVIIIGIRLMIDLAHIIFGVSTLFLGGKEGFIASFLNVINHFLITTIVSGITMLWTWLGTVLVMKSSRENEFEADEFARRLGFGNELCALLDTIGNSEAKGLFATLASSHPRKDDRIAKLQEMGATYRLRSYANT